MSNGDHGEIVEPSEQLVGVDLDQERVHLLLLDHLVQVVREVVRDDVEVLHLAFVGQEAVLHQQVVRMFQHLQDLVFPVLVFLVLQHLLNGYLLACCSVCPEIDHSKGALPCHPLNLILAHHGTRLGFLGNGDTGFTKLIGFSFEMFVVVAGLGGVYFEVAAGRVGLLGHVLGVDVDEFGLGMQFLCFLELVPEGVGFIDFGDHPAVHLLVRTALLVLRLIVIK